MYTPGPCSRMHKEFSLRYHHKLRLLLPSAEGVCTPWFRALLLCGFLQPLAVAGGTPAVILLLEGCQASPLPTSLRIASCG